jgi:hypothetical protein
MIKWVFVTLLVQIDIKKASMHVCGELRRTQATRGADAAGMFQGCVLIGEIF